MFDTQKSNQLRYLGVALALPQELTAASSAVSVNSCATLLPAHDPAHVMALLAWAVGIAKASLSLKAQHGAPAHQEPAGLPREPWPAVADVPTWVSPATARRQKVSLLHLGKYGGARLARRPIPLTTERPLPTPSSATNGWQFDGRRWTLRFAGTMVTQRNLKGWRYLTFLLQRPHEEVHVLDLLQLTDAQPGLARAGLTDASADRLAVQGLRATRGLDERTTIDAAARAAYRQRWVELQGEIEEAEQWNDPARAAKLRAEEDFLAAELAIGYGSRGHSRTVSETAEKARKAVTNRMRDAIAKLQHVHPALWRHLVTSLKTGAFCSYQPAYPTRWVL